MFTIGLLVCVLGVSSCGDESSPEESGPEKSSKTAAEGVPLPEGAEAQGDEIWLTPDLSHEELVEFYEQEMPEGEDFRNWKWCDTGGGEENHTHIYSRGAREILAVAMVADDPPGVIIGSDKSGPC